MNDYFFRKSFNSYSKTSIFYTSRILLSHTFSKRSVITLYMRYSAFFFSSSLLASTIARWYSFTRSEKSMGFPN